MTVTITLNGIRRTGEVQPDTSLYTFLRQQGCLSVKCGCETSNCGLCTVHLDGCPVLSCSVPAFRADGHEVTTLEGVQKEAEEFGAFLADEGGEQCGFCSPGFILSVLAMARELENPTDDQIKEYLAGNLCRCTGYQSQLRAIKKWLAARKEGDK
ncbi:(2Fe-2S)-binding protein [Angelakisella massiliensis]|uniref:(2Fe-2S)-binding protein n=1 Tax=Angelakisella massiliensis TaxID=1871018 RepID=UPI0008F83B42|nr:(2Fe-2S)-binding protein [Angelakisella massiliensis]